MSRTDQLSGVASQAMRLLDDEYVQDQIGQALTGLRRSSRRAKSKRAGDAIRDRKLWEQLGAAASSLLAAFRALSTPPPPKRHPFRRVLVVVVVAGAGGLAWQKLRSGTSNSDG